MVPLRKIIFPILIFISLSCSTDKHELYIDQLITENWQFRRAGSAGWLPAKVPGDVISDLFRNKRIPDPFYRMNEKEVQWIENEDWEYKTTFNLAPEILSKDVVELFFEGLDTYAEVTLNDSMVLKSNNMFRTYSVNCKTALREEGNVLKVLFRSPVKQQSEKIKKLPSPMPSYVVQTPADSYTKNFTRKASFQYGSEWGPRLVTSGIWRPVHIHAWSLAKISRVYFQANQITDETANYSIKYEIESHATQEINYDLLINNKPTEFTGKLNLAPGANRGEVNFSIAHPKLWWCNGLGDPYLYNVSLRIKSGETVIHEKNTRLGVRKLELVQKNNDPGFNFYFKLNNVPVFIKGASYVPSNILTSQVTPETYRRVISNAVNANMNMIRVCGNTIYENDLFYDLCDENGILVWQDFMFASPEQPYDNKHLENIRQETVDNLDRLRNHPCLALWFGNSDNMPTCNTQVSKINYPKNVSDKIRGNYDKIFQQILPQAVKETSPQTYYRASWPFALNTTAPGSKQAPSHHCDVWCGITPFGDVEKKPAPFENGYGLQSFPEMKTINSFCFKQDQQLHSQVMDFRQRCPMPSVSQKMNGNGMILEYIKKYYPEPKTFPLTVYASQVMQAEAIKTAIENHRKAMPRCMGSLYWQLNDCWPAISWSTVDYFGRWKLAHYAVRDAFSPILVVAHRLDNNINIQIVNDLTKDTEAILLVKLIDFTGNDLYVKQIPVKIKALSSSLVLTLNEAEVLKKADKRRCCLVVQVNQPNKTLSQNILYFTEPKNLLLQKPSLYININEAVKGYNIILRSDVLVKNVYLHTQLGESYFAENNFDLMPEKRTKINVRYNGTKDELMNDLKITSLADIK